MSEGAPPRVLNVPGAFDRVEGLWRPHLAAELNGQQLKLARIEGAFDWHAHPDEDEAFLVVKGRMRLEFEHGVREMGEGDLCVVPRGVRHRPVADAECHIVLFEPAGTVNTGDAESSRTVRDLPRL
ncbi:cupin domain-containing protein [Gaopeijia maritima]|uniref:Cupin domain-containing protein n=1 Tax=Gaopeijia maritima TaxID=3119007 RepID=A0ABU9E6T1_9BACT